MLLKKWNWLTQAYEDKVVPSDWNCKAFSTDMDEIIDCPHCGKRLTVGESYTSMELHTDKGFGYSICADCYEKEWQRRIKAANAMNDEWD